MYHATLAGSWRSVFSYSAARRQVELLGTRRMMDTQLASSYSIKHAKSVNKVHWGSRVAGVSRTVAGKRVHART